MKRIHFLWLPVCILMACKDKVETASPARENITESVYASGILKSKNQYQVFASVNGLLQKVLVDEGDTIQKGAPLFIIQNEISTLSRENAQLAADLADFKSNQSRLEELKLNIELSKSKMANDSLLMIRQQSLWSQNLGSKVELERAELNFQNSKTIYNSALLRYKDEKRRLDILSKQAKKNLEISRESESDFTITSKVNGKIYSLLKEQGEMVNTQTPLAVIGDADEFILELQVDEYDITSVKTGQKIIVTMDSYKGQTFEAVVTKINPILNERTKTALVEATFVIHPPSLYPNLTLEANIIIQIKENVLTLPRQFILNDHFVINEAGDTIPIQTGVVDYRKAEVVEGISEKDVLIRPGS